MKIAFVAPLVTPISEPQLGGSQAILADIAGGLAARGHDVSVFAASGSAIEGVHVVDTGVDPASLAPTLFRATEPDASGSEAARRAFASVYELVAEDRPDVVHNHAFDAPAIELADLDVPVVHTLHLPPRPAIAASIGVARARGRRVIVACVSQWSLAAWCSVVDVDVLLPNGVPVERIPFDADGGTNVLFAGRLSPEKGAAEAIEIAHGAGLPIMVVGDAYDEAYVRDRIEPYRDRPGVELRPAVPRSELWSLMGSARAVLCPISWDEPFGLVAAEAQASGTPVIAFDRGALSEIIVNGATGALVTDARQAVEALHNADLYDRRRCRTHAERDLSLEQTLDAHEELYARLVPTTAGSR